MKKSVLLLAVPMLLLALASCKPTEKNYKSAYDAAIAKKEKASEDDLIPEGGLLQDDGAKPFVLADGRNVGFMRAPVKDADENAEPKRYYVVVATFSMHANAAGMAERMKKSKLAPSLLRQTDEKWYVAAAGFDDLSEASDFAAEYLNKHEKEEFIGLDGTLLILESSRWRPKNPSN